MEVDLADGTRLRVELPRTLVLEDIAPRLWDLTGDGLPDVEVASLGGVTNHAIGEEAIAGGLRACPGRPPEVAALSADRATVLAIRLEGGALVAEEVGPTGPGAIEGALACGA